MPPTSINKQSGFTLVEIAVIVPIVILVLGGIFALLIGLMSDNIRSRSELEIINNANDALHVMEDDIKLSSAFLTTIGADFTDPYGQGMGNAWSYKGDGANDRVLIMQTYATTRSPRDSQKTPVYIDENGCGSDLILSNPALSTNTVYFVDNGNLYRRTLTNTSQTTCAPQFQRQSCPADLASPNALCKTEDTFLLGNITSFTVDYYQNAGDASPIDPYPANNPAVLDPATAIKVKFTVSKNLGGRVFTLNRELTASKLNEAN